MSEHAAISLNKPLLLCFSHLRWNFVFQRPQHLMILAADSYTVVFIEEPLPTVGTPTMRLRLAPEGVWIATPLLPDGLDGAASIAEQRALVDEMLDGLGALPSVLWFVTPFAYSFAGHLRSGAVVYDCMDELTLFRGASSQLVLLERQLLKHADLVFSGGRSLHKAKRLHHANAHLFPSSVDADHFKRARAANLAEPADQARIPHPRIGYFGVIDERIDLDLLDAVAKARPDWHFVMVGPTAKIDPATCPQRANLHWLGMRSYAELPGYLAGWDVGIMPFALNEATRFISPTKTPEFLAAGVPVVSTAVRDVVDDWGKDDIVQIAHDPAGFCAAIEGLLVERPQAWLARVDERLKHLSWRSTWDCMLALIQRVQTAAPRPTAEPAVTFGGVLDIAKSTPANGNARGPTTPPTLRTARHADTRPEAFDWLIVGAGFAGAVLAERLANERGDRVLVIDKRDHVAGNAYDHLDEAGILVHRYGPHIFHTNSDAVHGYLSQFTSWRPYEHRVLGHVDSQLVPIPINLDTVNRLYGLNLTSDELEDWFAARAEKVEEVRTSEDVIVSRVGRELYEKFFQGYTRKQWGLDPSELDRAVTARVPVRTNRDDRYFTDTFQTMPQDGYTAMFNRMLDHPGITVMLGTSYQELDSSITWRRTIWTGPVDEFFDHRFGKLPYRSLRFQHETIEQAQFQTVGTVNHPQDQDYTRVSEYKHLTGQVHPWTSVTYEYPTADGDPYYPIPRPENHELYKRYEALADACPDTWFVGRLATYRYLNMDQVVGQALATFRRIEAELPVKVRPRAAAEGGVRVPAGRV